METIHVTFDELHQTMAPVRISSGPEPKMTLDHSSSSLVILQMMFGQNGPSLVLQSLMTFDQISSNLVSQMSQRRLLASLQAPFLKEKKGVRFSALYLQQKRNLLVLDHSHQQVSYFFHARSVVKWINVDQLIRKGNLLLDLQKLQMNPIFRISVDIFVRAFTTSANVPSIYIQLFWNTLTHDVKTGVYSFQVNEHWLTLSADLLRKALNVTPADSAHPFESPPAGHPEIYITKIVRETLSHVRCSNLRNRSIPYAVKSQVDADIEDDIRTQRCKASQPLPPAILGSQLHLRSLIIKRTFESDSQESSINLVRTQFPVSPVCPHIVNKVYLKSPTHYPVKLSNTSMICEGIPTMDMEILQEPTSNSSR
ncbi:hypothetical protein Tco_0781239 [Tanacetum coccineum]